MNAGDKAIKFTFSVDRRTLDAARAAIRELTSDIKTLVETMSRAHSGLQSIGGGTGLFGGIGAKSGSGSINPGQQQAMRGGSMLTQGIAADAKALAASTKVGTDAIRSLTSGMRSGVNEQVRALAQLQQKIKEVEASLKSLKTLNPAGAYALEDLAGQAKMEAQLKSLRAQSASMASSSGARIMPDGTILAAPESEPFYGSDGMGRQAGPGMMGRIRSFFGRGGGAAAGARGGGGGGGGNAGAGLGAIEGMLVGGVPYASTARTILRAVFGSAAGQIAGGVGAFGTGFFGAASLANTQEQAAYQRLLELPMRQGRLGARIGQSLGNLGMQIRGGDLASSIALTTVLQGQAQAMGTARIDEARRGIASEGAGLTFTAGNLFGRAGEAAGRFLSSDRHLGNRRLSQYQYLTSQIPAQRAEEITEMIRNEIAKNPKLTSFYNETYGNSMSDIELARTGNISLKRNRDDTNMVLAEFKARAIAAGYSPGSVAGARASLGAQAGRGLMGAGQLMLGLGYGGLGNAGSIYGVGAQFGGGGRAGAMGLLNALQSGIGSGGMDVTAGGQVGDLVARAMAGGNFMAGSGQDLMRGLLSAGFTGTTGGDMRMARILQSGFGEYGRNLSGATDPLQQGINALAAVNSGARGYYAQQMLMQTDPASMLQMLRKDEVKGPLAGLGVGIGQLQAYNNFRNQYAFSRFIDVEGSGTDVGGAVSGVKSAGSVNAFLRKFKTRAEQRHQLELLGTARMLTEGGSLEENMGALAVGTVADRLLTPDLRGKGAGAVSIKRTIAGAAAQNEAKGVSQLGEFQADNDYKIVAAIKDMFGKSEQLAGMTSNLVKGATDFDKALSALTAAIVKSLRQIDPKAADALTPKRIKAGAPIPHMSAGQFSDWVGKK